MKPLAKGAAINMPGPKVQAPPVTI
jgi:hypothetical protein